MIPTLPGIFYPGLSLAFYNPDAFLIKYEVGGGLTINLKLLSAYALKTTLIGTSELYYPVLSLNSLQNYIMFIPKGPRA